MGFSPHLLLILALTFLNFSLAIDRTNWNHVCVGKPYPQLKSCDYRRKIAESLENIAVASQVIIFPEKPNAKFHECKNFTLYKRNRTEERFKERIESELGHNLTDFITRMKDAIGLLDYADDEPILMKKVMGWRSCAVEQKTEEDCASQASLLSEYFNNEATEYENATVDLKIVTARFLHLQIRNYHLLDSAQLFERFHEAVTTAHKRRAEGDNLKKTFKAGWCDPITGNGDDERLPQPYTTDFTTVLNMEAISMNYNFKEMEKIDNRTIQYLMLLKEFHICETIRGRYHLKCAEIRIKADKIDPMDIFIRDPILAEKNRKAAMKEKYGKMLSLFRPTSGIDQAFQAYENETETSFSDFINNLKKTMSSATETLKENATSIFKIQTPWSCGEIIRDTPIVSAENELTLIHNIVKDIILFRSKLPNYLTIENNYKKCVEKYTRIETTLDENTVEDNERFRAESVKKFCGVATLTKQRKELVAIVNVSSTTDTRPQYDESRMSNRMLTRRWEKLESTMEDLKASGNHTWMTLGTVPSKMLHRLIGTPECKKELDDIKTQAAGEDLNKFDESWNNTKEIFEKLQSRVKKEFAIADLFTKLEICSDEDEFNCYYLGKQIDDMLD